tara:strand:- start:586 stop:867 length:282 start_codon:yes stop_codon:yes gene_type:complete
MENELNFNVGKMGYQDIESMKLIIDAWYNLTDRDIFEAGFNTMSGYVYISLENGVTICSCFGQEVEYLVTDYDTGEEYFYETYEEALNKLETL